MLYLIEYDRQRGELLTLITFDDDLRKVAEERRLALELELNRNEVDHEVILLQAEDETSLRRTHRRYFENLTELVGG